MGKALFQAKLKLYRYLIKGKDKKARRLRHEILHLECAMRKDGQRFKTHHIIT